MSSQLTSTRPQAAAMDDALDRLRDYRFVDGPGMAVHAPMGAEALAGMGLHEAVPTWVEGYRRRHAPLDAPGPRAAIDEAGAGWRAALGDPTRLSDWAVLFDRLLDTEPWPDVVARWVPRLLPGYGGALTHGLLRTAHAVRTLAASPDPSPLAHHELAMGLAYWAGTYRRLPGEPRLAGTTSLAEALPTVPRPGEAWSPLEAGQFLRLGELPRFAPAVEGLAAPTSADPLGELTATFARFMLAHPDAPAQALVHTLTPVVASRSLVPYVPGLSALDLYARLWHVNAAIVAGFTRAAGERPEGAAGATDATDAEGAAGAEGADEAGVPSPEDLAGRAAEHGDPHAVKFTEAMLREHAHRPDPAYLQAVRHVLETTPAW
jgi:hypothetical protein